MEKFEDGVSVKASGVVHASGDVHSEDIMQAVGDIIIEYKKKCVSSELIRERNMICEKKNLFLRLFECRINLNKEVL